MARITFSPLIAGASGKAADAVFSKWKSTAYVRKLVTPSNPQTSAQQEMRNAMGRMAYMWRQFRSEIQTLQNTYGVSIGISGFNWFARQNAALEKTYGTYEISPPDADIEPPQSASLADNGGGSATLTWTGGATGANIYAAIYKRKVESGEEADAFTEESWETVLASAGTASITLSASKDWLVSLFLWDSANALGSATVHDTITMGA